MHYLQCEHCRKWNPVKSEYLVFCKACGKKIDNNYPDWHKKNQGKSFDDYLNEVCTSAERLNQLRASVGRAKQKISPGWVIGLIAGALLVAKLAYFGNKFAGQVKESGFMDKFKELAEQITDTTWVEFENQEAGFRAMFPKKPQKTIQNVEGETGALAINLFIHQPVAGLDKNLVYSVAHVSYPADQINYSKMDDAALEAVFKKSIDGSVSSVEGSLVSVEKIKFGEFPVREVKIDFNQGLTAMVLRYFLVGNNLYILQVIHPPANANNPSIRRFMDSFELLADDSGEN